VIRCDEVKNSVYWATDEQITDSIYECEDAVLNIYSEEDRYVTQIDASHYYGRSNSDVNSLFIHRGKITHFPRFIEKFFPKLIALNLIETTLSEINKEDFKGFPELIRLNLGENKISILEKDLFMYNPNLRFIGFNNNRIIHVETGIFLGLKNLVSLEFKDNTCLSDVTKNNRWLTIYLIYNIQDKCFDEEYAMKNFE